MRAEPSDLERTDIIPLVTDPRPVRHSLRNDAAVDLFRPVRPSGGIPRLLRRLVGVSEDILDWVPEERPRYTRLGAIVLNTGIVAAVSMAMAVGKTTGAGWATACVVALIWMAAVVVIDSWLISSTHGSRPGSWLRYLPRLVLSLLLGVVIAEPLVLSVFGTSIENEIGEHRKAEVEAYEGLLKRCNPSSGPAPADAACAGALVNTGVNPAATETQLAQATRIRDDLRTSVAAMDQEWTRLNQLAMNECTGVPGPGTTGVPGVGGECRRNRTIADDYRRDHGLDQRQRELAEAQHQVESLTGELAAARDTTERATSTAIAAKVQEKRANLDGSGILDEFEALQRLSDRSTIVLLAHWLLAALLVALDCLPVLTKMMSGSTAYDHQVRHQLATARRLHDEHLVLNEKRDTVDLRVHSQRLDQRLRNRIADLDGADRTAKAHRRIAYSAQINRLAATLESQSLPHPPK
ncbi:hypothetical protein JOD54_001489 [Actinokineospora baliensis]|uniref:DUF4407 domain-containing protein n=1 Tax=Actinokineospora baliensis TaxID=547056 RepID=UPI00195C7FF6|nr:DUF4407 domain-containing protein [Actinokineospora baliensis]MBM7771285.1 hypothetical protein [Actinokineospora baliensis]